MGEVPPALPGPKKNIRGPALWLQIQDTERLRHQPRCAFRTSRTQKKGEFAFSEPALEKLQAGHVCCLQTFGALCYLKLDSLAFVQRFVAVSLNGGEVHKHVLAALAL